MTAHTEPSGLPLSGHWINGAWHAAPGTAIDRVSPATGERVGAVACGGASEAAESVSAARHAFEAGTWAQSPRLRAAVLQEFAARVEREADALALLMAFETGKLLRVARGEIAASVSELRFYAGIARAIFGRTLESEPGNLSLIMPEPAGVAAILVPWNAPVILLVRSLAPALAAGCTVVVKPALQSSLVNAAIMRILAGCAQLPRGVVNSFSEQGSAGGELLVASPEVQVISFTGSSRVGKAIMAAAAPTLKRLNLELGGKAPAIVLEDCEVEATARRIATEAMILTGQQCTAITRVLVHERIYAQMKVALGAALAALRPGAVDDPASALGPLIDTPNRDRIVALGERAAQTGELLLRGEVPGGALARGAYLSPSLVAVERLDSDFVQQEFFGPLVNLERFGDDREAVARANATRYGLAASVWTRDLARAHRIARALRSGTVWINDHNKLLPEVESGGYGDSGVGRLHGALAMQEFQQVKHVYQSHGTVAGRSVP